jgi:hypothetical protein
LRESSGAEGGTRIPANRYFLRQLQIPTCRSASIYPYTRKTTDLLAAREAEIRRAAVLGFLPSSAPALIAAAKDRHGAVAAAAGARLCERRTQKQPLPAEPPLRKLALAENTLPEDVVGMLPCLVASTDPADRAAIEELRTNEAMAVREAITRAEKK